MSAADVDGWRARELMAPLFMGDDEELQALIQAHLILPYLFGDFHPSHIQEYAGGLLFALEKPAKDGGGIRPIICGESWRRCFASLTTNAARGPIPHVFTSTYENFLADCWSQGWRFLLKDGGTPRFSPLEDLRGGGRKGWCEEWARSVGPCY